jgi:hypothetical protein
MRVFGEAAAGDVRHPLDDDVAQEGEHGLHVDPRRFQQRVAERSRSRARHRLREIRTRSFEYAAY